MFKFLFNLLKKEPIKPAAPITVNLQEKVTVQEVKIEPKIEEPLVILGPENDMPPKAKKATKSKKVKK